MKLRSVSGWILTIIAALALSACATDATDKGSYEQGAAAYERGDYLAAYEAWRSLSNRGNSEASFRIADMHDYGTGVEKDYGLAAHYYRKAAERGHAEAQFRLAGRYDTGLGVIKDGVTSLTWYMIARDNEDLSPRNRDRADSYLRTFHSTCALEQPRCQAMQAEAQRRAEAWQAQAD